MAPRAHQVVLSPSPTNSDFPSPRPSLKDSTRDDRGEPSHFVSRRPSAERTSIGKPALLLLNIDILFTASGGHLAPHRSRTGADLWRLPSSNPLNGTPMGFDRPFGNDKTRPLDFHVENLKESIVAVADLESCASGLFTHGPRPLLTSRLNLPPWNIPYPLCYFRRQTQSQSNPRRPLKPLRAVFLPRT